MSCFSKKVFLFFLAFFTASGIFADPFRVKKTVVLSMNENPEQSVKAGITDAICIKLPEDLTFIQGIELNIKIPPVVARCPNTIIYTLYENISPMPSEKTIDYTGKELFNGVYPGLVSLTVQIPLVRGNTITKTPYAEKTLIPEHSRNFVFIRNQLAMKGVPNEINSAEFTVTAKPIMLNKGRLIIKTKGQAAQNLALMIDDKLVELDKNGSCLLKPGVHNISLSGDDVRNENRQCIIENAKDTVLEIDLQSTAPTLQITMPQGTHVSVDGQQTDIKGNILPLTPGDHLLKFTLGGYEIVKQITVQEGRTYSIKVTLDCDISEN